MRRQGRKVRSRTGYILRSDRRIFQNMNVRDPRHNSYHFMVVGSLSGASLMEHSNYLGGRTRLPLRLSRRQTRTRAEELFAELQHAIPKTEKRSAHHNLWISAELWRLIENRVSTRREPGRDQQRLRQLGHAIPASLKEERRWRVTTAGEAVESLLTRDSPLQRESLEEDTGVVPRNGGSRPAAHPSHTQADQGGNRGDIPRCTPPPRGETIPVSVPPYPIDNSVPTEEAVEWEVRRLWGHRSGGPYQMRAEHLREWLREHRSEEAAKVKANEAEAKVEAEAEVETLGSEERESEAEEGTADGG